MSLDNYYIHIAMRIATMFHLPSVINNIDQYS